MNYCYPDDMKVFHWNLIILKSWLKKKKKKY